MSRVHCSDCGAAVVVDPSGLCPDGHHVGAAGARVAQGMGTASPHADEPEPWVAQVVLDDDPTPVAVAAARRARPVGAPGMEAVEHTDQDSLFQELHALAEFDIDGFGAGTSGTARTPAPQAPSPTAAAPLASVRPTVATPGPSVTRPPSSEPDTVPLATPGPHGSTPRQEKTPSAHRAPAPIDPARGDELAALEAALHELSLPDEPAPTPVRSREPAASVGNSGDDRPDLLDGLAGLAGLAELDELFGATPVPANERHDPPANHAPAPGPAADIGSATARPARTPAQPAPAPARSAPAQSAPAPTRPAAAPSTRAVEAAAAPSPPRDTAPPTPAPAPTPSPAPTPAPAPVQPAAAPARYPAAAPAPASASASASEAAPVAETVLAAASLDIGNFTAKGGKVGGRKRRFGR